MHAIDVVETLPTARASDAVLSAVQMVVEQGSPGLVVTDEQGKVVGCLSSVDLLRLALPGYVREDPGLARVFDEEHADRVVTTLQGLSLADVMREATDWIPTVRPEATLVELAELMTRRGCLLVLVQEEDGRILGIVSANHLLELLTAVLEDPAQ